MRWAPRGPPARHLSVRKERDGCSPQVNTVFKGTTLRGMLLDAYAFWQMGQIAFWAAIVSFIGAGILLILSALGLVHARRVSPTVEILSQPAPAHKATTTA